MRRGLGLNAAWILLACRAPAAAEPLGEATFADAVLAVAVDVPADWIRQSSGTSHVFSGPEGSDAYFTTLTLQPLAKEPGEEIDSALGRAYAPLAAARSFAWKSRMPMTVAGRPALFYRVELEHHESLRSKACALVDAGGYWLELCYAATPELFAARLPAFEEALRSLSF